MRPILFGDQNSALFAHQQISRHLPVVLEMLARTKLVTEIDISDNSLTPIIIKPLVDFVMESDQLSMLHLHDNPAIGPHGIQELLEGIQDSHSLESLSLSNTGCTAICGHAVALVVSGCSSLLKLNVSRCRLRQSVIEIAQALPSAQSLKQLNLSQNELFYGQRRLALQLGANCGKCSSLTRLDLSQNAITTEMVNSLLRGLADAPHLHSLDLSKNEIGEFAGRGIAAFIGKAPALKKLILSLNPLLNITANKVAGQVKMDEEKQKPGAKKSKSNAYIPGCYLIIGALNKSPTMKEVEMFGIVVNLFEWEQKLLVLGDRVKVRYRGADQEMFKFRPKTATPPIVKPISKAPSTPRRK
jgi:Ran GTPase-activating protein (RanGAP) involved in mRNA processing and transport